ncbi:MAG: LPXTG cell wall anchor domain-containing protein, partial [Candidatus Heimdallarchaeaceae archaeon]
YVDGHPYEYTIEIIVTDIDGRTTKVSVNLADEPIPEETNAALVVSLIALLTFGSLVFRRKRR